MRREPTSAMVPEETRAKHANIVQQFEDDFSNGLELSSNYGVVFSNYWTSYKLSQRSRLEGCTRPHRLNSTGYARLASFKR